MRRNKAGFFLNRVTITAIISAAVFFFVSGYFVKILKSAEYFKIKEVLTNEKDTEGAFSYLKGRGIFNIDLKKETGYISGLYPAYQKISLVRILPDRLAVYFSRRIPLAYVKLYRYFCVDDGGVLFDPYKGEESEDLPVIVGLETKIFGVKSGMRYKVRELLLALEILKEVKKSSGLQDYLAKRVDVANPANATCFLYPVSGLGFLEVRLGQGDIPDKINMLSGLFGRMKNDLGKIRYVDLRFKEPVIKYRDAK